MNIILFSTICGLLAILIIYKQRKCWYFIWQLNGWRGLLQQPILWLLLIIYLEPKSVMSSIQRCHKYFQFPLAIIVFNRILLYVDDPETMESILTAPECLNKTFLQNGFYANKGLLHAKDEQWKIRRKQLNPAFSHNTLVSFFGVFNRVANELNVKIFKDLQGYEMKFKSFEDLIIRAVLQVSCLTTMGFEINFLQQDEKHIAQSYRFLMELTALRILKPWYQIDFIFRWLEKKSYEKSKRANKLVTNFVTKIVQQKHIEWQQLQYNYTTKQQKPNFTTIMTNSKFATATTYAEEVKDKVALNAYEEKYHNFVGNRSTATNDALKIIIKENYILTDTNVNPVMEEEQRKKEMLQRQHTQRIFIDQIFYLAQSGKLSLEDIMNESQSMVVVSFETVSSCIINALLCLAINHECQMKLRHEIKQILAMSKEKICDKNKTKMTIPITSINDDKDSKATAITTRMIKKENESSNKTTANRIDNDWDFVNNIKVTKDTSDKHGNTNTPAAAAADNGDVDIDEHVNNDCDVNVTMEHLLNMPYLDMIINESLRLLTTVPMNLRNVSCDFKLNVKQRDKCSVCKVKTNYSTNGKNDSGVGDICGCSSSYHEVVVPKDTMIALDTFSMQRNELYWGENALKFNPEHFAKRNQLHNQSEMKNKEFKGTSATSSPTEVTNRHSYAFIPFSKGLRTCIGYRYSIYLSKIVLIKLISSFEFSTNIQLQDLQCYEGVSLKFRNADKINFQIKPVN